MIDAPPLYVLPQQVKRVVVPKALTLIVLTIILYLGILLNISLLELTPSLETTVKFITLIFLIVVIVIGIILALIQAKRSYLFYQDRIAFGRKEISYRDITITTASNTDRLDKMFHTYSINLGNNFSLKNIPEQVQIQAYLQQMIEYVKRQQPLPPY